MSDPIFSSHFKSKGLVVKSPTTIRRTNSEECFDE